MQLSISNPLTVFGLFVLSLEAILGTFSNVFIMGIFLNERKINKIRTTGNKIRIAINISNICLSTVVVAGVFSGILLPENVQNIHSTTAYIVYSLNMLTTLSSAWLSATLSLFYCLTVVDFKTKVIVWAKKNISGVIPWVIVGVEVVSILCSFSGIFFFIDFKEEQKNISVTGVNSSASKTSFMGLLLIVGCVPYITMIVTTSCTTETIVKHRLNMMMSMGTSVNHQAKSIQNTTFKMILIFMTATMYYAVLLISYFSTVSNQTVGFWVYLLLLSSLTTMQSLIFIAVNKGVRETLKKMLKCTLYIQQTQM